MTEITQMNELLYLWKIIMYYCTTAPLKVES